MRTTIESENGVKHAIRHIHFGASMNAQPKPGLCGAVPANASNSTGGLMA